MTHREKAQRKISAANARPHIPTHVPARLIVGENAPPETYQEMRTRMRLDRPLMAQYVARIRTTSSS